MFRRVVVPYLLVFVPVPRCLGLVFFFLAPSSTHGKSVVFFFPRRTDDRQAVLAARRYRLPTTEYDSRNTLYIILFAFLIFSRYDPGQWCGREPRAARTHQKRRVPDPYFYMNVSLFAFLLLCRVRRVVVVKSLCFLLCASVVFFFPRRLTALWFSSSHRRTDAPASWRLPLAVADYRLHLNTARRVRRDAPNVDVVRRDGTLRFAQNFVCIVDTLPL